MEGSEEKRVPCPLCDGLGLIQLMHLLTICPDCGGWGTLPDNHVAIRMRCKRENGKQNGREDTG